MKTKIRWLVALFALLAPGVAGAQPTQPMPIVQARTAKTLWTNQTGCAPSALVNDVGTTFSTCASTALNVSGYASAEMNVKFEAATAATAATDCGQSSIMVTVATEENGVYRVPSTPNVMLGAPSAQWTGANTVQFRTYVVHIPAPHMKFYLFTQTNPLIPKSCNVTASVTFSPLPDVVTVLGTAQTGMSLTSGNPVLIGGIDNTSADHNNGAVRMFKTDPAGYMATVPRPTTSTVSSEILVDVVATEIPSGTYTPSSTTFNYTLTTLQNTGPDPIYCGFDNTVTTTTGFKLLTAMAAGWSTTRSLWCIADVAQSAGAGTRVVLTNGDLRLYGGGGSSGGGGGALTAFAPGIPTTVNLSASTSNSLCGLTVGADYELSCTVPAAFRHSASPATALLTDNPMPAGAVRSPVRMPTGSTCFAFISSSTGSCTVSLLPTN